MLTAIVWPLSRLSLRAYPNFAYMLWVVVLIKALIPYNITLPARQLPVVEISPIITGQFMVAAATKDTPLITFSHGLMLFWGLGVTFFGIKLLISEIVHRKRLARSVEISPSTWFHSMVTEIGLKRPVRLFTHESVGSPFMQGLWNIRIYLPTHFLSWSDQEQQNVLAHELMHARRNDIIVIYLQAIVRTVYFFHPAVWLTNDQIDLEREKICDDAAIALSKTSRQTYGDQLFQQISNDAQSRSFPVLAGGFFMSDNSVIKRFRYIIEKRGNMQKKLKSHHIILILGVIITAVVIACDVEKAQGPIDSANPDPVPLLNKNVVFEAYDDPPKPIGGYKAIQEAVEYPDLARAAGIEGTTIVQITLDSLGVVQKVIVLKSADNESLDAAAMEAVKKVQWEPAKKLGAAVAVRVSVPVVFRLTAIQKATGWRPMRATQPVQVVLKGTYKKEHAKEISIMLYIDEDGVSNNTSMKSPSLSEGFDIDMDVFRQSIEQGLREWYGTRWVPDPEGSTPEPGWVEIPLEFEFK
ncbi:MAG: M56 family metallopeptidase [Candidatus Marinimicrobia bacterium]|nr:M56 family metallopeptidase [Candidatus Neomarinimicrobiota bacterium]MCF7905073.1 M56 family metallopeptidase [Candidatus Neomarinimicrobiota bacterium]